METIKIVKNGRSIQKCIEIPDAYLDKELEITIRPIPNLQSYRSSIEALFKRYPNTNPFNWITDVCQWERGIRSEW